MRMIILVFYCVIISSCSSNTDLIAGLDRQIEVETKKIEKNSKESEIDIQQMKFISLELEAAKLKSDVEERIRSSKDISERIKSILAKGKQRELEDSISAAKIDSLLFKKKEFTGK